MYSKTTHHITVTVQPYFLDEHSNISENRYVWAYRVAIQNNRQGTVKLCRRHWQITDATGRHQEVRGDGVVGEQPVIPPGGCFEYTSGVPLSAPSGIMMGVYDVRGDDGREFSVDIPAFSLDSPHQNPSLH